MIQPHKKAHQGAKKFPTAKLKPKLLAELKHGPLALIDETMPTIVVAPMVYTVPLLSYHVALIIGTDVDQPRNLVKSVTVE